MTYDFPAFGFVVIIVIVGLVFAFPWLLCAWSLQLIKSRAWKWILSLPIIVFSGVLLLVYLVDIIRPEDVAEEALPFIALLFLLLTASSVLLFLFIWAAWSLGGIKGPNASRSLCRIIFFFVCVYAFLYIAGIVGSSRFRLVRDHSLWLPPSVCCIECDCPISLTPFGDFGAFASFEISRNDLPRFLAQFPHGLSKPNHDDDGYLDAPANFKKVIGAYQGGSRDGNYFRLDVHEIDSSRVGICISTCWN